MGRRVVSSARVGQVLDLRKRRVSVDQNANGPTEEIDKRPGLKRGARCKIEPSSIAFVVRELPAFGRPDQR